MRNEPATDPLNPYKDLLILTIVGPEGQTWKQRAIAVPRIGEQVACFDPKKPEEPLWAGKVKSVTWGIPNEAGGLVAVVHLSPS